MRFKEMPLEERQRLLKDQDDLLTPIVEAEREFYERLACPRCRGLITKELDLRSTMSTNRMMPKYNCRCSECGCLFVPETGMIIELGNMGQLRPDRLLPVVDPSDGH